MLFIATKNVPRFSRRFSIIRSYALLEIHG